MIDDKDNLSAFKQAMQGVKPLVQKKMEPYRPTLKAVVKPKIIEELPVNDRLSDWGESAALGTDMDYQSSGIQYRMMKKLRSGKHTIDAKIDLHGMNVAEARASIASFLSDCEQQQWRCILIIHGKGYQSQDQEPVLKRKLNHWLRQYPTILAFCSAQVHHGGGGALYVLLKRQRL